MTYLGRQGNPLDRGVTLRDLADSGIIDVNPRYFSAGGGARVSPILGVGRAVETVYEVDLTPPPMPTGFAASAAISNIMVEHAAPAYTQGHGHARTHLYGATWVTGPLPTFANAVEIEQFTGTVASHATNPATTWHLWIKWESNDGVLSTTPAGGTNGLVVTTGQDVALLMTALTGKITESQLFATLASRINLVDGPDTLTGSVAKRVLDEATARGAAITLEQTQRQNADNSLATSISLLTAGVAGGFDVGQTWYFDTTAQGWTSTGGTQAWNAGYVDLVSTGTDPQFVSPGALGISGSTYPVVKARVKRLAGSGWDGTVFYSTAGHGFSALYCKTIPAPSWAVGDTVVLEWDMSALTAGGSDWLSNTITQIRLDLGASAADQYSVDWAAVGRNAPGASQASVLALEASQAAADLALSNRAAALEASVNSGTTGLATKASISYVDTSKADAISASAGSLATFQASINAAGSAINRLYNPAFLADGVGSFANWVIYNNAGGAEPTTVTIVAGADGFNAARVSWTGLNTQTKGICQNMRDITVAGTWYVIAFKVRSVSGLAGAGVTASPTNAPPYSDFIPLLSPALSSAWQWYVAKARRTAGNSTELFITITSAGSAGLNEYDICQPIVHEGEVFRGFNEGPLVATLQTEAGTRATQTGELYAQYTVKTDVAGLISGYGLASTATNAAPTSSFGVLANSFFVAAPAIASATAPTVDLYDGYVWLDTSVTPNVRRYRSGAAWTTTPPVLPFMIQTTPTTVNGVAVPAGVYIQDLFVRNGTITNAKIGNLQVDDSKIVTLSVSKLTAGSLSVGQYAQSYNYSPGLSGWTLNGDGSCEVGSQYIRGQLVASQIDARGLSIKDAQGNVILAAGTPLTANYITPAAGWLNANVGIDATGALTGIGSGSGQSVANNTDSVIRAPGGGVLISASSPIFGALKILLPQAFTNTMMRFVVEIYEYGPDLMCTVEVGGYNYGTGTTWHNVNARVIGSSNVEYPVFFGKDVSGKACVWIGSPNESWSYPQVRVRDFFAGYQNYTRAQWESGWSISFDATVLVSGAGANQYSASVIDTLPGADWSKTARRPANVAALTGSEGINNAAISMLANGALQGAGGGQVTIGGLGYTGDLNASSDIKLNVRGTGLILSGNSCSRPTGGGNFDADCYSSDAYVGGAACSFMLPATGAYCMAGLNTDPLTDTSYASIDYAFYKDNTTNLYVYESGVSKGVIGIWSPTDVLAVIYDGQFVRYLQNGNVLRTVPAAPGLKFYFDSSIVSGGINNIRFGPYANTNSARGANLIDSSWWNTGIAPTSIWASNQGAGSDAFVVADLPDGSTGLVWRATQDAAAGPGGGWNPGSNVTNNFPVNPNKSYMFVCFTRSVSGTAGTQYLGLDPNAVCTLNTVTPNDNPYFAVTGKLAGWHMHVGWVYPAGEVGHDSNGAGVYRCADGVKVGAGLNFSWNPTTQNSSTRAYQYYGSAGAQQDFVWPIVFLCDGSEPSLDDLLGMAAISGRNKITPLNAANFVDPNSITRTEINPAGLTVKNASGNILLYAGDTGVPNPPWVIGGSPVGTGVDLTTGNKSATNTMELRAIKGGGGITVGYDTDGAIIVGSPTLDESCIRLGADRATTALTSTVVTGMSVTLKQNSVYRVTCLLRVRSAAAANGIAIGCTVPVDTSVNMRASAQVSQATREERNIDIAAGVGSGLEVFSAHWASDHASQAVFSATVDSLLLVEALVTTPNTAAARTFQLTYASEAGSQVQISAGSMIRAELLPAAAPASVVPLNIPPGIPATAYGSRSSLGSPATAVVSLEIKADGTWRVIRTGATDITGNWTNPLDALAGTQYDVQFVLLSGALYNNSATSFVRVGSSGSQNCGIRAYSFGGSGELVSATASVRVDLRNVVTMAVTSVATIAMTADAFSSPY
jgi:hypothetical protein